MDGTLATEFQMSQQAIDAFGALVGQRAPHLKRKAGTGHHSDPAAAKSVGLRGPVAYSLHYYGHVADLMLQRYGARWLVIARTEPHPRIALGPVYRDARFSLFKLP